MNSHVYIYALKDPRTDKIRYVGKAVNPRVRLLSHLEKSRAGGTHKDCWIAGLKAQGLSPVLEVLDLVLVVDWPEVEQEYIRVFKLLGMDLTNLAKGGENPPSWRGRRHSEEAKKKIGRGNLGRKHSAEARQNMRLAHLGQKSWNAGRKASLETREKQRVAARNKPAMTEETREKMRNRVVTEETRNKLREAQLRNPGFLGRKHTPESRARMSASHLEVPGSEEHIKNMELARQARRAREAQKRNQ